MGFIKNLLSMFKNEDVEKKEVKTMEKSINYNDKLIDNLKEDHKTLFKLYRELLDIYKKDPNNFKKISEKLHDLKLALEVHLMVEDTQLYTYLEKKYNDEIHQKFIKDVEHEMEMIAKEAINFVRKYSDYQSHKKYKDQFLKDAENIGKVLTKRVEMEEKRLYTLYIP